MKKVLQNKGYAEFASGCCTSSAQFQIQPEIFIKEISSTDLAAQTNSCGMGTRIIRRRGPYIETKGQTGIKIPLAGNVKKGIKMVIAISGDSNNGISIVHMINAFDI